MAQRHQDRHLRRARRRRGPDVWEFLWREFGPNGKRRQRTLTVGSVDELRTEREALNRIQLLRANINRDLPKSALMTFEDLVNHYRQTELLADNKTEKARNTYLVYLRNWILPTWGKEYLHNIKPVAVEHWLRNLGGLSNGSKCKVRTSCQESSVTQSDMNSQTGIPSLRSGSRVNARKFQCCSMWRNSIDYSTTWTCGNGQ